MENRRSFIKKTALGTAGMTAGFTAVSAKSYARILGANERVNMALNGEFEKFIDHDEANMMLTRKYRHPYVVPKVV